MEELPYGPLVDEPATIVNADELLQTPLTAEPQPAPNVPRCSEPEKAIQPKSPLQPEPAPPARTPSINIQDMSSPVVHTSRSGAASPAPSSAPSYSQRSHPPTIRSSSTPLTSSTIAEDAVASFPPTPPLSPPANTLLAQRNAMLHQKSLTGRSSRPASSSKHSLLRSSSASSSTPNLAAMPRGERRSLPQSRSSTSVHRTSTGSLTPSTNPSPVPSPNSSTFNLTSRSPYSSPTPSNYFTPVSSPSPYAPAPQYPNSYIIPPPDPALRRPPTSPPVDPAIKRASMLAAFRNSVAEDLAASRGTEQAVVTRREEMWGEKVNERRVHRSSSAGGGWRDVGGIDGRGGMGVREMGDAHREVLRRMQAGANARLNSGA